MGTAGGDPRSLTHLFEAALRRAEADGNGLRVAGRADAARRLAAAETERREILTATLYRASLVLREAEARAAEIRAQALEYRERSVRETVVECRQLRDAATVEARSIRGDAAEEIAKLMSTLNTDRDHILADARDDARRRIVERARELYSSDDVLEDARDSAATDDEVTFDQLVDPHGLDDPHADAPEEVAASSSADDLEWPPKRDGWMFNLDELFPEETSVPWNVEGTLERRRKRKRFRRRH